MAVLSESAYAALVLSLIRGVGPKTLRPILEEPEHVLIDESQWPHLIGRVAQREGFPESYDRALRRANEQVSILQRHGDSLLCIADDIYPELLRQSPDAPPLIFVRGNTLALGDQALAIVGTRRPTRSGEIAARRVADRYARNGWAIVSGLAEGIDAIAHDAAIAANGATVAVLAHGLDSIYPPTHIGLAKRIVQSDGALLTEFTYGTRPNKGSFIQRDRVQAGLSRGVCVVQTSNGGGSLHACRSAIWYGRPLVVPDPTLQDVANGAPAVEGILSITGRGTVKPEIILKGNRWAIEELVFRLRSKDDYERIDTRLLDNEKLWEAQARWGRLEP